jgi:hypothetical protein
VIATSRAPSATRPGTAASPTRAGAIGAYDGHRATVGRVVVDSTWHHFININLIGTGNGDPAEGGFVDQAGQPTAHYRQIRRYFRNIATWLSPAHVQRSRIVKFPPVLRYLYPLLEELRSGPSSDAMPATTVIAVGRLAEATVSKLLSRADMTELVVGLAQLSGQAALVDMLEPWSSPSAVARPHSFAATIRHALLGGALQAVARELPASPSDAPARIDEIGIEGIERITCEGVYHGVETIVAAARHERDLLSSIIDRLCAP